MSNEESLLQALYTFGFPEPAAAFLLKVWRAIQFLDDVYDGDEADKADIHTLIVALPSDPFLHANLPVLSGALASLYFKWVAANNFEEAGEASAKSYMWRAGFYDLVLTVAALCKPHKEVEQLAPRILALYGETLEDYLKEFGHA